MPTTNTSSTPSPTPAPTLATPQEILRFWYVEAGPEAWYKFNPDFDATIRQRFSETYAAAAAGELFEWRRSPEGRLAEIIVLDQLSRNMFRDTPGAFASDPVALILAQEAVAQKLHLELGERKSTLLMPYMHSESKRVHAVAIELFADTPSLDYERRHKEIIDRFGRYPHRNGILGRTSTAEELAFLETPGSSF
ncbi:MAG: DUF924 family protein [Myxococcota bacterium]